MKSAFTPSSIKNIRHIYLRWLSPFLCLAIMSFVFLPKEKIKIYIIGDSTAAEKDPRTYPETGWGMPFKYYFDSSATVDNRALNGRSTRTFMEEGHWKSVMQTLKAGDYVLIQFGHNDEVPTKKSYTTPEEFKKNLVQYVNDTRSKNAHPILLTPVVRRAFDSVGNIINTHPVYSGLVKEVAAEQHVPLIDMDSMSHVLLKQLGEERSKFLWIDLAPEENPHYPKGRVDNTHFNELGARRMAELVLKGIEKVDPDLAARIQFEK